MVKLANILLTLLALGTWPLTAGAETRALPPPVAPQTPLNWTPVPGVQGISYLPDNMADLFRFQNSYYYLHEGRWYQGRGAAGPWTAVRQPPQPFYNIQAPYFKRPPGWAKGKKTGWRGAPLPPGQMKKMEEPAPGLPPYEAPPPGKGKGKGKKWD